ncbi:MAG: hypothetical protein KKE02_00210 [Alphaproteobacteria bacterium]|nr:hypothetical protein [Alphaproteobacteria bacterium]MBU1514868.1 hypothetical protein [Alphaproteobacteria bacterium]MBU2093789.1 hypothetical protein [Alphaproteobacteria bacterium]MBU2149410.1 hypothetical protein [Alphaproteobacteria bacterium]MBU2305370.1 hypothetical protein [Alphaproteobacteria bacterium]
MTTIRPNLYPQTQAHPQAQDSGKLAAQRAFFDALSQARAPTQTAAASAPTTTAATQSVQPPVQRMAANAIPTEQPQKILRPGSLFDIRV